MDTSDRKLVVYICFLGKNMQAPNAAYLSLDVDLLLGCAVQEYFDLFIHVFKKKNKCCIFASLWDANTYNNTSFGIKNNIIVHLKLGHVQGSIGLASAADKTGPDHGPS